MDSHLSYWLKYNSIRLWSRYCNQEINVMKFNIKNTFSDVRHLALLTSLISISLLGTGCKEKPVSVQDKYENTAEAIVPVEEEVLEEETDSSVEASEPSQKSDKNEDGLSSVDSENSTAQSSNGSVMEILLTDIDVIDGDTIQGLDESGKKIKVRMIGIDAPEIGQPMSTESAEELRSCIGGESRALLFIDTNIPKDKYGRTLARVESAEIDCNQQQIEKGMAWFYAGSGEDIVGEYNDTYNQAHDYAQDNQMGVWAMDLEKPWDYRENNK